MPNEEKKEPMTPEIVNPHNKAAQERIAAAVPAGSADVGKKNEPDIDLGFGTSELKQLTEKHSPKKENKSSEPVSTTWLGQEEQVRELTDNLRETVQNIQSEITERGEDPNVQELISIVRKIDKAIVKDGKAGKFEDQKTKTQAEMTRNRARSRLISTVKKDPDLSDEQKQEIIQEYGYKKSPSKTTAPPPPPDFKPTSPSPKTESQAKRGPIIPPHAPTQPNKVTMKVQGENKTEDIEFDFSDVDTGGPASPPKSPSGSGTVPPPPPGSIVPPPPTPGDGGNNEPELVGGKLYGEKLDFLKPKSETKPPELPPPTHIVSPSSSQIDVFERIAQNTAESARVQKETLDTSRISYTQFVENEKHHEMMFPPEWKNNPPKWYEKLSDSEKSAIRARMTINLIATRKDAEGNLDAYFKPGQIEGEQDIKIKIEAEGLDQAWMEMPGYRVAFATILNGLFEMSSVDDSIPDQVQILKADGSEKLFINNRARNQYLVLKKEWSGTNLLSIGDYKRELTEKIKNYLDQNPNLLANNQLTQDSTLAAEAAVSFAWNTVFMSAAIDSGDRRGKERSIAGPEISSDSIRSFFLPLDKALFKLSKEGPQDIEEKWGGPLGDWYADRAISNSTFADEVKSGKYRYFPERLFYSWLDFTSFDEVKAPKQGSFASVIMNNSHNIGNNLFDVDPQLARPINLRDGGKDGDLWWRYSARASSARTIYEILTEDEVKNDAGDFATAFNAIYVNEPWLRHIYLNMDLLTGVISKLSLASAQKLGDKSASGYLLGTNELVLNARDETYDESVKNVIDVINLRIFKLPELKNARKLVMQKLHALDLYSMVGAARQILPPLPRLNPRAKIRMQASRERSKKQKLQR